MAYSGVFMTIFIYLLTNLFIYLYLTTLRQVLSLFSKITMMLWGGINIRGTVVAILTVSPFNYVWKN